MSNKAVAKVWTMKSGSSSKTYETLQYTDESTSCNCFGWTRRVDAQGNRSCKHTRSVHQGTADSDAEAMHDYTQSGVKKAAAPAAPQTAAPQPAAAKKKAVTRKVMW